MLPAGTALVARHDRLVSDRLGRRVVVGPARPHARTPARTCFDSIPHYNSQYASFFIQFRDHMQTARQLRNAGFAFF